MTLDEYENYIIKGFAEELGLPYNKVSCTVREHHISELPKILSEGEIKPKSRDRLRLLYQAYQTSDFLDCRLKDEPAVIQQKPTMKWMYVGSDETDLEIIGGGQNRNNNRIMYDIVDMNTIVLFACQKTNTGQIMICVHETM